MATSTSVSPDKQATDVVSFKILADNNVLSGEYRILSIDVFNGLNKISAAKIVIADGDPAKQDFPLSSKNDSLIPGHELEIQMGYQGKSKSVFKGIITRHIIKSNKNKVSGLTIEAKDKAVKLTIGRKSRTFTNKTDSEIIQSIFSEAGFKSQEIRVDETGAKIAEMVQYNSSDWDFIVSRAEMNSMFVFADGNITNIKKPDTSQEPVKEITFGKDVIEFDSEIDGRTQIKEVKGKSWNYKDQKMEVSDPASIQFKETGNVTGESLAEAFGVKEYNLVHPGNLKKGELKTWSSARLLKSRMAKNTGRIKVKGLTEIKPGEVIKLNGFGKRFNGNAYVTGVRHCYNKAIWETEILYGLDEQWFYQAQEIVEKPASGLVPGVTGLQIGIVTNLEGDPDKEDRVKISIPSVDENEGIWARIASLDAGKDRGAFFRPEIHDEVVVGFLNNDPRHAIILGMLNSSAHPAPLQLKDDNHQKGFITRSKIKLVFDDDKKILRLETPGGRVIEINDDNNEIKISDKNSNKIKLSSDGIAIESLKDISIKTTAGNVKIEGKSVEVKAATKSSISGAASAELVSTGQTKIKGGVVNIN